ncbi:MAG: hypothetical protein Q4G36_06095 [Paracoccus sp. (in: a-proteobacteria)]|nr:hypothetical protein [Paracoccus sp. (in: a-proteobacteria)]
MTALGFDPWLGWWPVWAVLGIAVLAGAVAVFTRLRGWAWRVATLALIAAALAGPGVERATTQALSDIVLLLDDRSASNRIGNRTAQTDAALDALAARIAALPATELRRVTVEDAPDGSLLGAALARAIASEPEARLAGVIALSDGLAHDPALIPGEAPAPVHILLSGQPGDWDRRLIIDEAPGFGLIGQEVSFRLRIEDQGAVPESIAGRPATVELRMGGELVFSSSAMPGQAFTLPVTLENLGENLFWVSTPDQPGELTGLNNAAALGVNGLRDRLRVLLVSGEPNPGARSWRNLLKSDAAVDLIHFTILRPPEKSDGVPVEEMSLIPFPTHELFMERISDFDLIIFDRYRVRGILMPEYYANIRRYVEEGGAILVSAGPEIATVDSLALSPLGPILPAQPTGRVIEAPFRPELTEAGRRHPVTSGLEGAAADPPDWGRWLSHSEMTPEPGAEVVMEAGGDPLLMLRRVGEGRVALLASDQVWLWGRGFEGGGPQLDLLRRIAHWSMKEPELEEDALSVSVRGEQVTLTRRSLSQTVGGLRIDSPAGGAAKLDMEPTGPGRFAVDWQAPGPGLYIAEQDGLRRSFAIGPPSPREFQRVVADGAAFAPLTEASGGTITHLSDGIPDLRIVPPGRPAAGQGLGGNWIAVTPRGAEAVTALRRQPLMPGWAWLGVIAVVMLAGWLAEGRRRL